MLSRSLGEVSLGDIEQLVANEVPEGKTIEYKRDFYRLSHADPRERDKQHEEMLKDMSSFANTIGGDLIIGVEEVNGVPTGVCGFPETNSDGLKLRICQIVENWIEPRVSLTIHSITHSAGKIVLVIRIQQSLLAPHRVVYKNLFGQFWARKSAGAFAMDTAELRQAFALSETMYARIKSFRESRVESIIRGNTPAPLTNSPRITLHLIPQDSFASKLQFPVDVLQQLPLRVMTQSGLATHRFNMDGVVWSDRHGDQISNAYVQVFRNGIIESVVGNAVFHHPDDTLRQSRLFMTSHLEILISAMEDYMKSLLSLGISPPVWCFLSVTDVNGVRMPSKDHFRADSWIDRTNLLLPELEIAKLDGVDCDRLVQPLFDLLWNAAGHRNCPHFKAGRYQLD